MTCKSALATFLYCEGGMDIVPGFGGSGGYRIIFWVIVPCYVRQFKLYARSGPLGCYTGDHVMQSPMRGGMPGLRDNDADSSVCGCVSGEKQYQNSAKRAE
jgi:hypothetical protein